MRRLFDNIFVNTIEKEIHSGNLMSKLSDHLPNFIIMNKITSKPAKRHRFTRDFSSLDEDLYKSDLYNINLNSVITKDVDTICLYKRLTERPS